VLRPRGDEARRDAVPARGAVWEPPATQVLEDRSPGRDGHRGRGSRRRAPSTPAWPTSTRTRKRWPSECWPRAASPWWPRPRAGRGADGDRRLAHPYRIPAAATGSRTSGTTESRRRESSRTTGVERTRGTHTTRHQNGALKETAPSLPTRALRPCESDGLPPTATAVDGVRIARRARSAGPNLETPG
jgi:hypothetical protein